MMCGEDSGGGMSDRGGGKFDLNGGNLRPFYHPVRGSQFDTSLMAGDENEGQTDENSNSTTRSTTF